MKSAIEKALNDTFEKISNQVPELKNKYHTIDIMDVEPLKLAEFMKENSIPDTAEFSGLDNGYDGYDGFVLLWTTPIPTTKKDKDSYIKERFERNATTYIHKELTKQGYYKKGFDSILYRRFTTVTLYDRYLNKDFDTIADYYAHNYFNNLLTPFSNQ